MTHMPIRIEPFRLAGFALAVLFGLLCSWPSYSDELSARAAAVAYLKSLPSATKIYVWPTKLRPYEVVGDGDVGAISQIVSDYNANHTVLSLVSIPILSPLLSIFLYDGKQPGYMTRFASASRLPSAYKRTLGGLQMDYQACVFTNLLDRDTWADGGVVFIDRSRLPTLDAQRECILAGLDYVNGFPTTTVFDYRQFPSEEARRLIVEAISACSLEGGSGPAQDERTKDGLTPLPDLGCVIRKLSD